MASAKATVQSFEQAEEFLAGGRNKTSRPLANNTYVERRTEDRIAIRLHATDVVEFTRSGLIFLNTGGWRTVTTKDRINMVLSWPVRIFSERGVWRVKVTPGWDGPSVPFADNMALRRINDQWEPVAGTFPDATEDEKIAVARKALNKAIAGYLKRLDDKVDEWRLELDANGGLNPAGDPWCCTMGIGGSENDHLWQHIREGYVFLTLVRKAMDESGRYPGDPVQRLLISIQMGFKDRLRRDVRKYLLKHLDPALSVRTEQEKALKYVAYAEEALQRPSDFGYFGTDESLWVTSAPTFGRNRDSENVENANFEIVWENLVEKFPHLVRTDQDRKDENPGGIYVFGAGHWACGWVEQIVVPVLKHPGTITADNLHPAFIEVCDAAEATRLYPALPGAEERAAEMDHADIVKDIKGWQKYLSDKGDPYINAFTAEQLAAHVEDDYDWYSVGVLKAHAEACYDDSLVQVDGQGVLL